MVFDKIENLVKEVKFSKDVDTRFWREFKMCDLFEFKKGTTDNWKLMSDGDVNMITTSSKNNGVVRRVNIKDKSKIYKKCLTLSNNADGWIFWQEEEFAISKDNCLLKNKFLNKYSGIFISAIWNSSVQQKGYGWGNKTGINKVKNETILLPSTSDEKPNYEYMEQYIKNRERDFKYVNLKKIKELPNLIKKSNDINVFTWNEFLISDVFNIYSSKNSLDKNKIKNGNGKKFNYITRTNKNNGIFGKISKQNVELNKKNCLTIGLDTQTCFYQDEDFYTGQNVHILRINNGCREIYLFITTILQHSLKLLYSWGSQGATIGRLKNQKILLPVDKNNKIDWKYMKNFIVKREEKIKNFLFKS